MTTPIKAVIDQLPVNRQEKIADRVNELVNDVLLELKERRMERLGNFMKELYADDLPVTLSITFDAKNGFKARLHDVDGDTVFDPQGRKLMSTSEYHLELESVLEDIELRAKGKTL